MKRHIACVESRECILCNANVLEIAFVEEVSNPVVFNAESEIGNGTCTLKLHADTCPNWTEKGNHNDQ